MSRSRSPGPARSWKGVRVYTVGHSTRSLDELVDVLRAFDVDLLVDIRTVPRSRRNPQFDLDTLPRSLRARRIGHLHVPALGGRRHAGKDSRSTAWRNPGFRGYADHMQSREFADGLAALRARADGHTLALMCAEAVPWRCHRSLVADALVARGAEVQHITSATRASPHRVTPFAEIRGTRVTYPGEDPAGQRLPTAAPFHLEATVRLLQRRPGHPVDVWDEGRYRRVLPTRAGLVLVEVTDEGRVEKPDLRLRVLAGRPSSAARAGLVSTLRRMLGLDVDPAPLDRLVEAEPGLAPLAPALRGMRPPRLPELFETVASVVPFQQVSLDAGVAVVRRLVERFGPVLEHDGRRHHGFPDAASVAAADVDEVKACGLTRRKAETLVHAARAIAEGELDETELAGLPTPDALHRLAALPGIGPWSAALVLLRGLGRLEVFPPADVGVERGLAARLPLARALARFGESRGYLYFCALGAALVERGLIPPATRRPSGSSPPSRG